MFITIAYLLGCVIMLIGIISLVVVSVKSNENFPVELNDLILCLALIGASWFGMVIGLVATFDNCPIWHVTLFTIGKKKGGATGQ